MKMRKIIRHDAQMIVIMVAFFGSGQTVCADQDGDSREKKVLALLGSATTVSVTLDGSEGIVLTRTKSLNGASLASKLHSIAKQVAQEAPNTSFIVAVSKPIPFSKIKDILGDDDGFDKDKNLRDIEGWHKYGWLDFGADKRNRITSIRVNTRHVGKVRQFTPIDKTRIWKDVTGKYSVRAEFVSFLGGKVKLRKTDTEIITIEFDKLSEEDQDWIRGRK